MTRFFTITNKVGLREAINLDYLVTFRETKEGDDEYVQITMRNAEGNGLYTITAKDTFNEVFLAHGRANY